MLDFGAQPQESSARRDELVSKLAVENKLQHAKLDFLIYCPRRIIGFETDEGQHKSYNLSCEQARMADVQSSLLLGGDTRPLLFIRYNPHAFRVKGQLIKLKKRDREARLVEHIKQLMSDEPIQPNPFAIHFMYFDTADGLRPAVCDDPDWNHHWDGCVSLINA